MTQIDKLSAIKVDVSDMVLVTCRLSGVVGLLSVYRELQKDIQNLEASSNMIATA